MRVDVKFCEFLKIYEYLNVPGSLKIYEYLNVPGSLKVHESPNTHE